MKVRDPIYGFISLSHYEFVKELVDTALFQRLGRLCQLGVSVYVYPSAVHNRFIHSLGAMELFARTFDSLFRDSDLDSAEVDRLKRLGIASALLHDIGHGPFSHASEKIFDFEHQNLTKDITEKSEIRDILSKHSIKPTDVTDILQRTTTDNGLITQCINSQLDIDRLDYLARDAYFCGVGFGNIDVERIIRMLRIYHAPGFDINGFAVSDRKGISSLESYIMTRHLMYQDIYFHKATRCLELLIANLFNRAMSMAQDNKISLPEEIPFLIQSRKISWEDLSMLDDHVVYT